MSKSLAVAFLFLAVFVIGCANSQPEVMPESMPRFVDLSSSYIRDMGRCWVVRDTATGDEYLMVRAIGGGLSVTPLESKAEKGSPEYSSPVVPAKPGTEIYNTEPYPLKPSDYPIIPSG